MIDFLSLSDLCYSIAVELFVPGLVLPPEEVNSWNPAGGG
jgi:hypothetical protein